MRRRKRRVISWKNNKLSKRGKQIRLLSTILACLCVALVIISITIFNDKNRLDEQERQDTLALVDAVQTTPKPTPVQDQESQPRETPRPIVLHDVDGYPVVARISIAKLELELSVIGVTTDEALKVAPCLFSGPSTPQDTGNIVVTGHNNKDGSQFGKLKELKAGDTVMLMDRWGDTFTYEVYDIETIKPDDMAALEIYDGEHGLTLITCTSNGNRRLLLRCRMIGSAEVE